MEHSAVGPAELWINYLMYRRSEIQRLPIRARPGNYRGADHTETDWQRCLEVAFQLLEVHEPEKLKGYQEQSQVFLAKKKGLTITLSP